MEIESRHTKGKESFNLMGQNSKEAQIKKATDTVMELNSTVSDSCMKASGSRTRSTGLGDKFVQTGHTIRASGSRESAMALANRCSRMDRCMMASGEKTKFMASVGCRTLMVHPTMEGGRKATSMVREFRRRSMGM